VDRVFALLKRSDGVCDPEDATPMFQPFFLNFFKVHVLATNFFLQMWNESGAAVGDFTRVVALVRSQYVFLSLTRNHINLWVFAE
jgi:engulfment and cell motility protein 1